MPKRKSSGVISEVREPRDVRAFSELFRAVLSGVTLRLRWASHAACACCWAQEARDQLPYAAGWAAVGSLSGARARAQVDRQPR